MKKLLSKILIINLLVGSLLLVGAKPIQAGGSLYLSPSGQTITQGSTFSVSVRVNTGGAAVDTAQANLSYPADKLDYLGTSYYGSAFEIQAESSGGSGSVRIGRGAISAKSGDLSIAVVSFRAKVSSGSASVSFTSGSEADRAGKVVTSATSGATYSFTTPPKPKPKDKTAPKISNIEVKNIGLDKAVVTWKTNEKASSSVEYGPSRKLGINSASSKLKTSHSVGLSSKLLLPGTKYYYRVKSKDAEGNEAVSKIQNFSTKGYSIKVQILDKNGEPLAGILVKLLSDPKEATTAQDGIAFFLDVSPGKHAVNFQVGNVKYGEEIDVQEAKNTKEPQEFEVKIAGTVDTSEGKLNTNVLLFGIAFVVIVAFVGGFVFWRKNRPSKNKKQH